MWEEGDMGVTALLTSVSKDQFCVSSARSRCTKIVAFLFSSNLKPMSLHLPLSCENRKNMKYATNWVPRIRAAYVSLGHLTECVPWLGKFLCQLYGCSVWTPVSLKVKLSTVFSYMTFFPPEASLIDQCAWQIAFSKWGSCLIFVIVCWTVPLKSCMLQILPLIKTAFFPASPFLAYLEVSQMWVDILGSIAFIYCMRSWDTATFLNQGRNLHQNQSLSVPVRPSR